MDNLVCVSKCLLSAKITEPKQLESVAKAYLNYEKHGQPLPNFHGLRDYYDLVRQLSLNEVLTQDNIQMALARNFGGIEYDVKLFEKYFGNFIETFNNDNPWVYKQISIEKLIDSNLNDTVARHLIVIGRSDSIVNLLTCHLRRKNLDPVVILGSQFSDDQDDFSYSVLSRIMASN